MPAIHRRIRLGAVIALVTAGTLAAVPAVASFAQPQDASVQVATQLATTGPAPAAGRTATALHGWAASPRTIRVHHRLTVPVRVTGGARVVRLERRMAGEWRLVDRERTTAGGRATLAWRPSTARTHVVLRVRVPATASSSAVRSRPHIVAVTHPAAPAPSATPSAAPTASPSATPEASVTATPAPTTAPATSASIASSAADQVLRAELLTLVNRARATPRSCGGTAFAAAPAVTESTALDSAAAAYAVRMATEGFFAHESPDGSTMVARLNAVGVRDTFMRENIAAGQRDADAVMTAWLQSPGHCANLMAADVTRIGLGHAMSTGKYGQYWVQDFAG